MNGEINAWVNCTVGMSHKETVEHYRLGNIAVQVFIAGKLQKKDHVIWKPTSCKETDDNYKHSQKLFFGG